VLSATALKQKTAIKYRFALVKLSIAVGINRKLQNEPDLNLSLNLCGGLAEALKKGW
jgi:hypothetical protein